MMNETQEKQEMVSTLFKPASWVSKIDFINHLVLFNNVLITVLAEHKGGKSSFVKLLEQGLDDQIKSASIRADAMMTLDQLVQKITEIFHLNKQQPMDMQSVAAQINERKTTTLLIIDDAHYLPDAWLAETLMALQAQGNHGSFHVCLISDFSLIPGLNRLVSNRYHHMIHTIELSSLNENETKVYLTHKLQQQGVASHLLQDELLQRIYRVTAGDLSRLNNNLPNYAKEAQTQTSSNGLKSLKQSAVALVVLALIGGGSYLYLTDGILPEKYKPAATLTHFQADSVQNITELESQIPFYQDEAQRQLVEPSLPFNDKVITMMEEDDESLNPDLVLMDKVVVIPAVKSAERFVSEEQVLASEIPAFPGFPPQTKTVAASSIKPVPANKKSQNQQYTIQVLASTQLSYIDTFIKNKKLNTSFHTYKVSNNNQTWYVLTTGNFPSYEQASKGIKNLPVEVTQMGPWVRSTTMLHEIG